VHAAEVVRHAEAEFGAAGRIRRASAMTRACSSHPAPVMRLPTTVFQLSL